MGARGSQSAERMRARVRVRTRGAMCASGATKDTRCARESVQSASWLEHGRVGHRCRKSFFAKEFFNFYSRAIRLHATHAAPDARRKDSTHSTLEPRTDEHHQRDRMHAARCTPHATHPTPLAQAKRATAAHQDGPLAAEPRREEGHPVGHLHAHHDAPDGEEGGAEVRVRVLVALRNAFASFATRSHSHFASHSPDHSHTCSVFRSPDHRHIRAIVSSHARSRTQPTSPTRLAPPSPPDGTPPPPRAPLTARRTAPSHTR